MRDFTRQERAALDAWITREPNDRDDEEESYAEALCGKCGRPYEDHEPVQMQGVDSMGGEFDYETYQCPQPETGSTFAKDNDPGFRPVTIDGNHC